MTSQEMRDILQLAGDYVDVTQSDRVDERRAAVTATLHAPIDPATTAAEVRLGSRPALWIEPTPTLATRPVVLYLHGGVYEVGSASDYQAFCSKLALRFDTAVVPLDYRLAPEHPFPAAVDDSVDAYRDLLERRRPTQIAIVGDSAGGGLTVACLIAARREGLPQPAAAAGISSWLDLTQGLDSHVRCSATDPFVRTDMLTRAAQQYLAGADARDPLASPLHASADELADLAPLLLQAAANEVLADDSSDLGARITDAGGEVTLELCPQAFHAWPMAGDDLPESRDALQSLTAFLQTHLQRPDPKVSRQAATPRDRLPGPPRSASSALNSLVESVRPASTNGNRLAPIPVDPSSEWTRATSTGRPISEEEAVGPERVHHEDDADERR